MMQRPLFARAAEELPAHAITLYQPWAWLVAAGYKPVENRPPGVSFRNFRGPIWIHAGIVRSEDEWAEARVFALDNGFTGVFPRMDELVYGAVIGRCNFTRILPPPADAELPGSWRMKGKAGFVVEDAELCAKAVPCRGFQGIWRVKPETIVELMR